MTKELPKIGERVKFELRIPKVGVKIMEGTVVDVSKRFGGQVHITNTTSESNFIIRLECLL